MAGNDANAPSHPGERRRRSAVTVAVTTAATAVVMLLATTACSGSIVHNYRTFQSALDRGASCSELFDQRARFDDEDTLAKIDRDLDRIGCTSRDATRTD
ncbi:MAG: hypothetical protein AB7J47_04560 [Acidimicrobiia bacterium]